MFNSNVPTVTSFNFKPLLNITMAKPKLSRKTTENRTAKGDLDATTPLYFELSLTKIFPTKLTAA